MKRDLVYLFDHAYLPVKLTIRSEDTIRQYRYALRSFAEHLGRPATLEDLCDDDLARWARQLLADGLSPYTINEKVGRVKAIWNWLARRRLVEQFPTLDRMPEPELTPRAWRKHELEALFDACRRCPGTIAGIAAGPWWLSFHGLTWATSERKGAVLAFRWEWLDEESGWLTVPAGVRKGGLKPASYWLWPEVLELLAAIREPRRELILPFPWCEATFYARYAKLLVEAGLPTDRKCKPHKMRVSHASWLKAMGGNPTEALGHESPRTTRKHYLDPTLTNPDKQPLFCPWKKD